jgi:hypothetical protein
MTESQGVVGPASVQTSIFDWEPSRLHPNLCIMSDQVALTSDLCLQLIPSHPDKEALAIVKGLQNW